MNIKIEKLRKIKLLNHSFILLFILGLLTAIHLTLYSRVEKDTNEFFLQFLLYGSIIFHIYQKRNNLVLVSEFPANFIGVCLIIIPCLNLNFSSDEISILWYFLPLINATGLALLASGFQGLKQFKRELVSLMVFPIIFAITKVLSILASINVISAKITSFILWYLGFESMTQGSIVYVNGGAIDIIWGCTAIPLLILLFKFSFLWIIFFPSLVKNIYLPFIFSVVISGIASIIRLIIMALVVVNKPAFGYWHGHQGGNIFAMASFLCFGIAIMLLSPEQEQVPVSPEIKNIPQTPQKTSSVNIIINIIISISLFLILLNVWLKPNMGLLETKAYNFPNQITLPSWQLINSKSLSIPTQDSEKMNYIVSGQNYNYQKDKKYLTVNLYYVVFTFGGIQEYYEQFKNLPNLPQPKNPMEKVNIQGHHLLFSDENNNYLTACINPLGKSTVTIPQSAEYFYRPYFHPSQWFNLLTGKSSIRDRRCLWGQLSLPKTDTSDQELETVWQDLLSYWKSNFPKSKL